MALPYLRYAEEYYRKYGVPTSEVSSIKRAVAPLLELYGNTEVDIFGPVSLKAYRERLIAADLSRGVINNHVGRVKRMFKWATENEMISSAVHQAVASVGGLRRGRTKARETEPVRPVDDAVVDATVMNVSRQVAAMIHIQRYTGMRPGEVIIMRRGDLDTSGKVWTYTPSAHKTEHHGRSRKVFLGPRAQRAILPFLSRDSQAFLFSPREVMAEVRAEMRRRGKIRKSKKSPRRQRKPMKIPGDRYKVSSYEHAIYRGCDKAFPPPDELGDQERAAWRRDHRWSPNQLRHNAATYLRKEYGIEAARVVLGHRSAAITEVYAELDFAKAADVMGEVGQAVFAVPASLSPCGLRRLALSSDGGRTAFRSTGFS